MLLHLCGDVCRLLGAGCYADTWDRLLKEKVGESATMTVTLCSQMAAAKKYNVFGVQYAAECW